MTVVTIYVMLESDLAQLLEGTADAAFTVDARGEIKSWNKSAERLFGHPANFAIGKTCASLIAGITDSGAHVCCEQCAVLECAQQGRPIQNFDMEVLNKSNERLWVNVSLIVSQNQRTKRYLAVHLIRDIHKRKRNEEITNKVLQVAREVISGIEHENNLPPFAELTHQELRILRLLAAGKSTGEVTKELQIALPTLRNHLYHINNKLHTCTRLEAVITAINRGII